MDTADDLPPSPPNSNPDMRRSSRLSHSLYGPEVSSREGRASYVDDLIKHSRKSQKFLAEDLQWDDAEPSMLSGEEEGVADEEEVLQQTEEESEDYDMFLDAREYAGPTDESITMPSPKEQRRLVHRLSMQRPKDPSKRVEVGIRDLSYHVPMQLDEHRKLTVFNQSVCYFTYEFFVRLSNLIKRQSQQKHSKTAVNGNENGQNASVNNGSTPDTAQSAYQVTDAAELFNPFTKRTVLHNISLVLRPGRTYLVLGPPNSGKTTLLRAIAGRLPNKVSSIDGRPLRRHSHMTGNIAFNGVTAADEPELKVSSIVSFVGQLDVHAPYLTVKETFDFAQQCRGGEASPKSDNDPTENLTIEGLGLAQAKDTFVGNATVRGISGGQRRRVTLGEMMQGDPAPPVACADEISTGLDAAVTFDICQSIVRFSKLVKTTRIVSLLQPGPETFSLFDEVILLSSGHLIYAGPVEDVVEYFDNLGYALPATMDVADFLQSVTTADGALLFDPEKSEYDAHLTPAEFASTFRQSKHASVIDGLLQLNDNGNSHNSWKRPDGSPNVPTEFKKEFRHSWWQSFRLNFLRHLLLWWRDKGFIYGKIFENVGMAAATGGILFGRAQIPNSLKGTTQAEWDEELADELQTLQEGVFSAIFMTCLHILLGTTTSTPDDIDERPIHYKQADAGFYHTTAFVFARLLSTLPQRAIEIVAFGIPVYFMVGLDASGRSFFLFLTILLLYTFALKVLYGIIPQILPNKQNVLGLGTFFVLLFALFSGFIVYPDTIPGFYYWFYWINPMAWAIQGMLLVEYTGGKYDSFQSFDVTEAALSPRGFKTDKKFIGYIIGFLVEYAALFSVIQAIVLKRARLEPKRAGAGEEGLVTQQVGPQDFNLPFTPVDLSFEDLIYEVKASTGDDTLRLLNQVSGVLRPGRLCALMGSSGAGKTTLMDVVALRKTSGTITGEVRMNGYLQDRVSFLRCSGYVEQFDVQQAELTVRETVLFSARLRLSRDDAATSTEEGRQQFVDYVLQMMELTNIQNFQVGSYEEGGLSFEQRKRLAIAVELAASPSVIFLDEPTSGLDSRGALIIMKAMKRIADTGRTVCATIHQPSAAVFEMFDDLLLLKRGGEVVFFGELGEESCHLVAYFESRGAEPIKHGENPAAWMLRAYTHADDTTDWKAEFETSDQFATLKQQLATVKESPDPARKIQYDSVYATSSHTQRTLMTRRVFHIMKRAPSYNLTRLMIAVLYSLILGTTFIRSRHKDNAFDQNDVDGIFSVVFLALIIIGVVSVSMAVPVMKQTRDVFYKHRASGMLSHNSVTMAVTVGELPYIGMMSAIFSIIFYSLVGLFGTADRWIFFFLIFGLNIATYTYFGQAFMCLVRDTTTAGALVGALIGFNVFFSGLVVRPQYFVGPFLVGFWTAPGRFAYEAIIVTQFTDLDVQVRADPLTPYYYSLGCTDPNEECIGSMNDYLDFFFGGKFEESHLGICLGVLFFCLLLARLLLWLALWKLNYTSS